MAKTAVENSTLFNSGFGGTTARELSLEANPQTCSTNSSGVSYEQRAVFPCDSILADFFDFAVTLTEGADCYVVGAILPVCAALLGRAVRLRWMSKSLHSNLFSILVGKPGERKSSTIQLAD